MDNTPCCERCDAELSGQAVGGLCGTCLLKLALDPPAEATRVTDEVTPALTEPTRIRYFGDYELVEEIARGGMGVVYKARQVSLNRIVALKMILAGDFSSAVMVERFRIEAEAAARLEHPNIVPIHEVGTHDGQHYFSMRFVEGGSLTQAMARGRFNPRGASELMAKVARAVHHAHQRGILHRDLKPGNILLDAKGEPHVADFGLAKILEHDSAQTQSAAVLGTPGYMAPEQAAGQTKQLSTVADVYSLGAVLYELLTGRPPFRGATVAETMRQVMEAEPGRPRILNPAVDRDLETIVLKCLEKDPQRRYGSAEALAEELDRWLAREPIAARRPGTLERVVKWARRRPAAAALIAVSTVALVAVAGIILIQQYNVRLRLAYEGTEEARKGEQAQRLEAERARAAEERQRKIAEGEKERAEKNYYLKNIAWAEKHWFDGDLGMARVQLEQCPPAYRHWEWEWLKTMCGSEVGSLRLHRAPTGMGFTASNLLVAIDGLGDTRLWDHKTAAEVSHVMPAPTGNHVVATLAADGRWMAFSVKEKIEVRAVSDGSTTVASITAPAPILHMAFSPNGNVLALVASDGEVFRWRFGKNDTLEPIGRRSGDSVSGLAVDNDGRRIFWALGGQTNVYQKPRPQPENGTLHFFDFDTKTEQVVEKLSPVSFLIVSPDGRSLAATHASKEVSLWPLHSNTPTAFSNPAWVLKGHSDRLFTARFSPDSSMLAAASEDQGVILWRVETGEPLRVFKGHLEAVIQIAFNQEGDLLAAADTESRVKVWNLKSPLQPLTIRGKSQGLAFSPDGKRLTSGNATWSAQEGTLLFGDSTRGNEGRPAFSADGLLIARKNEIIDSGNGQKISTVATNARGEPAYRVFGVSLNLDCRKLAFGNGAANYNKPVPVWVWDTKTGGQLLTLNGHTSPVFDTAFSPDGRRVAAVAGVRALGPRQGGPGELRLWDSVSGDAIWTHKTSLALFSVAFCQTGLRLAGGGGTHDKFGFDRGEIFVWDTATGREIFGVTNLSGTVFSVALSPDGKRLVAAVRRHGERQSDVKLWDVDANQEVLSLGQHTDHVYGVAFSPDGKRIASGGLDGVINIWSIE